MKTLFSARLAEAWERSALLPRIDAKKEGDDFEVGCYGVIGDPWGEGIKAKDLLESVPAKVATLRVRLNSPGGDPFEATAIGHALRARADRIIVSVDGLAASAASVLAMFGDEIEMGEGSLMMIHAPSRLAWGNAAALRAAADSLDSASNAMAALYASRVGAEEAVRLVDPETGETWYGAQEAVDAKLADRVITVAVRKPDEDQEQHKRKTTARLRLAVARSKV